MGGKIASFVIIAFALTIVNSFAVTVNGYCYLENQQIYAGTKVLFQAESPSAETDSAFTDSTGFFQIELIAGTYIVIYTHSGYQRYETFQVLYSNTTLPAVTLYELAGNMISGPLTGMLEPAVYLVVGPISVQSSDTLIIQPGTVLYFEGDYSFNIYGYLYAVGSLTDSIYFLPSEGNEFWGSLNFRIGSNHESVISFCHFQSASGSAINTYQSNITISNSTITNNSGNWGGGIYCSSANPTVIECVIDGNHTSGAGGGIYCTNSSPSIIDCVVQSNSAGWLGGGICCYDSSNPNIERCIIANNQSNQNAGGIMIRENCHPTINRCVLYLNTAVNYGGAIDCNGDVTIINSTFTNNIAYEYGGGIFYVSTSNLNINNTILWADSGLLGGNELYTSFGDTLEITYCNVQGGWLGEGNINADPLFVDPVSADFHLQSGSPCIDAGDPNSPLDPDSTIADIGAFYYDQSTWVAKPKPVEITSYQLFPNYPNPFNPTTILSYDLPFACHVRLKVYDILGHHISTLVDIRQPAGQHQIHFDASNLPSGIYFYRIESGSFHSTRKMILIR